VSVSGTSIEVELRCATLPGVLGLFAAHYWFVVWTADGCHRWEVWQTANAGGRSVGHVHCDLKPPDAGVGGGPSRTIARFGGDRALAIARVLDGASVYPYCDRYLAWPGPNSNTFVSWVIDRAGIAHRLGWRALGKRYRSTNTGKAKS
jgi:hypothetical protein